MSRFIVHSVLTSPFGRAVVAALIEKRFDYSVSPVTPGTTKAAAHLELHPFGRVPVLDHDGFLLYETQAILRYVDRVADSGSLTPTGVRALARMDQLMSVCDWYLFQNVIKIIGFQRLIAPHILGTPPDEAIISAALPDAHRVVAILDQMLGEQEFLTGGTLSLADLMIAPQIDTLARVPEWSLLAAGAPRLSAWHERMAQRPSIRATDW